MGSVRGSPATAAGAGEQEWISRKRRHKLWDFFEEKFVALIEKISNAPHLSSKWGTKKSLVRHTFEKWAWWEIGQNIFFPQRGQNVFNFYPPKNKLSQFNSNIRKWLNWYTIKTYVFFPPKLRSELGSMIDQIKHRDPLTSVRIGGPKTFWSTRNSLLVCSA